VALWTLVLTAGQAHAERFVAPKRGDRMLQLSGAKAYFGVKCTAPINASFRTFDGKTLNISRGDRTVIPGLRLVRNRGVKDPGARQLNLPVDRLRTANTADGFISKVKTIFNENSAYLKANDIADDRKPYIAAARQRSFFKKVGLAAAEARLDGTQKDKVNLALAKLDARTVEQIDHQPKIGRGIAADYHPYSRPFSGGFKQLSALAKNEVEKVAFHNTLDYMGRERTIRGGSTIKQYDIEQTKRQRLAVRTTHVSVSPKKGTEGAYVPRYVTIKVKSQGLPAELQQYAGKHLYREGGKYYLDGTGTEVAVRDQHVTEKEYKRDLLTMRDLKPGEKTRKGIKFNYRDPTSDPYTTPEDLSWTGSCHIESPAAALGLEAKSKVTLYRASAGKEVTMEKPKINDLVFGLYDAGTYYNPQRGRAVQLDQTMFAGNRNNSKRGGHGDYLIFRTPGARSRLPYKARLMEIHKQDGSLADQQTVFQRYHIGERELRKNPKYIRSADGDINIIKGDTKVVAEVKYQDFHEGSGQAGIPKERTARITLDPAGQNRVFVGSKVSRRGGTPKVTNYFFNPKAKQIESLTWAWKRVDGAYKKVLENATEPGQAPLGPGLDNVTGKPKFHVVAKNVQGYNLAREVAKESAHKITAAVEDTIRNRAGAVPEVDVHQPVWNFPMTKASIKPAAPRESLFANLSQKLSRLRVSVDTTGPGKTATMARMRDARGKHVASEFQQPFIDFIWAPNEWHAVPMAQKNGSGVLNFDALQRGMSWGRTGGADGQPKYTNAVYKLASDMLYLSMAKPDAGHVYGIRHRDGTLEYFNNQQEYQAARQRLQPPQPPQPPQP
jgi:hypothetical protein